MTIQNHPLQNFCRTAAKVLSFFVTLSLLTSLLHIPASASPIASASMTPIYVKSMLLTDGSQEALELIEYNGEIYISQENIARLAGMKPYIEHDVVSFWKDNCSFRYTADHTIDVYGTKSVSSFHVPLQKTADALSLSYYYDKENETLLFRPRDVFAEELVDSCNQIYEGNAGYSPYDIAYIYETDFAWVATLYNVFTNGKILHWVFGSYDTDQNKTAIGEILTNPDGGQNEIEQFLSARLKDTNTIMDALSKEDKLEEKTMEFLESQGVDLQEQFIGYMGIFGRPYKDAVAIYKAANTVKGLTPGDLLSLYHDVNLRKEAAALYLDAFKYGLGENPVIKNKYLQIAADSMYAFTKEKEMDTARILSDQLLEIAGENAAENISKKLLEKCRIKTNGIIVTIATWITDQFVADKTSAVDQAKAYAGIQTAIEDLVKTIGDPSHEDFDPVALKYATILYVRACQCCFHNFLDIKDTKAPAEIMISRSKNAILELSAFDDDQLSLNVKNKPLNLNDPGFTRTLTDLDLFTRNTQNLVADIPHAAAAYLLGNDTMTDIYRLDSNADRMQEWILKKKSGQELWCIMDGSGNAVQVDVFASSSVTKPIRVYQCLRDLEMIIFGQNEHLYDAYWTYERGVGTPFLSQIGTDLWISGNGTHSREEAKELLEEHGLMDIDNRIEENPFDFTLSLAPSEIERITDQLTWNSNVKNRVITDLNHDGKKDGILYYNNHFPIRQYIDGVLQNDLCMVTPADSCAAVLLSGYNDIQVLIMEESEAQSMIDEAVQSKIMTSLTQEAISKGMKNGSFNVTFYRNKIQPISTGGWTATVERTGYVTFTDAQMKNLTVGQTLNGIKVKSIRRDISQTPHTILINQGEMFLVKHDDGLWYQTGDGDILIQKSLGEITLMLSPALTCYNQDEMQADLPLVAVPDVNWFFTKYQKNSLKMSVTMKDGVATELIHWYSP